MDNQHISEIARRAAMKEPLERSGQLDSPQPGNRGAHASSQALQDKRQAVQEHHRALMEHHSILQALFEKVRDAQQSMQGQQQALQNFHEALHNHHQMGESYRHWEEDHYQALQSIPPPRTRVRTTHPHNAATQKSKRIHQPLELIERPSSCGKNQQ